MKPFRFPLPLVLIGLLSPLGAQAPAKGKAPEAPKAAATATPAVPDQADDITVITPILYKPSLKRDPFATPSDDSTKSQGNLVQDIAVKGVVRGNDGKYLAVIVDSHGKSTFVPVGFRLRDGEIVAIDARSVTFHQWELNTTNRSAYRTVVKTFKNEEAK